MLGEKIADTDLCTVYRLRFYRFVQKGKKVLTSIEGDAMVTVHGRAKSGLGMVVLIDCKVTLPR